MSRRYRLAARLVALALLAGCSGDARPPATPGSRSSAPSSSAATSPSAATESPSTEPLTPVAADRARARRARANELGVVPVLMYHDIVERPRGEFDRTPAQFRAELGRLYVDGYRPITAAEFASGSFSLPAGTSPVVLTFDDSYRSHFSLLPDGRPDPQSAVGMLIAFARTHPGFRSVATLYVNANPFGTSRYAALLRDLHRRDFELGNHTADHLTLRDLPDSEVQRQIALGQRVITEAVPGARVTTFALPRGVMPLNPSLALRGSWRGTRYAMDGVFRVGAGPAPSPYSARFNRGGIPRMRSSSWTGGSPNYGSAYWLDWLRRNRDQRFVSDGDPRFVSFPRAAAPLLGANYRAIANPY